MSIFLKKMDIVLIFLSIISIVYMTEYPVNDMRMDFRCVCISL